MREPLASTQIFSAETEADASGPPVVYQGAFVAGRRLLHLQPQDGNPAALVLDFGPRTTLRDGLGGRPAVEEDQGAGVEAQMSQVCRELLEALAGEDRLEDAPYPRFAQAVDQRVEMRIPALDQAARWL